MLAPAVCQGEYLDLCEREEIDPVAANRAHVAVYVRELCSRPSRRGGNVVSIDSGSGLANATILQRLVPVRLFYDFLMEEGLRQSNPVGRGRYSPGRMRGSRQRGLVPRLTKLPWTPTEQEWLEILAVATREPIRNRLMLALAYDAALRREELCSLCTDDLDPACRLLRVRAETTKNHLERIVPYSAPTGVLLSAYLVHRATVSRARGPLFLSESRRNRAQPLTLWTWSKVVHRIALDADVPQFSTHTTRRLCLTDLARMGWELHAIATFAGHRSTESTLRYIHLSGRDLADRLSKGMEQIHGWRVQMLADPAPRRRARGDRAFIGGRHPGARSSRLAMASQHGPLRPPPGTNRAGTGRAAPSGDERAARTLLRQDAPEWQVIDRLLQPLDDARDAMWCPATGPACRDNGRLAYPWRPLWSLRSAPRPRPASVTEC